MTTFAHEESGSAVVIRPEGRLNMVAAPKSLKRARRAGGDLRLAAASPQVITVLELTNLNRVLQPSVTVADARALVKTSR